MQPAEVFDQRWLGITGNPDYKGTPFTDFAVVRPSTRLEDLNLNWRERDLPERERTKHVHRLHPYLGKFVPQLVEIFLRKYRPTKVCDPFCGSGTTLVEASTLGIASIGCDISPFNCLLSRVKTSSYNTHLLEEEIHDILRRLEQRLDQNPQFARDGRESGYVREWFAPRARSELLSYRSLIPRYTHQDVLRVVLSRAARSARLTTHFDLDFPRRPTTEPYQCYKHRRICRPTDQAIRFLRRYSLDTLKRIKEFTGIRKDVPAMVIQGDSREVDLPSFDMVITSPPYVGLIDYHEQHRYAFELLGLKGREALEIGPPRNGNSEKAAAQYIDEMAEAFSNVARAMRPGGRMVVVVHDRRDLYGRLADALGFTIEYRLRRHVNRRTGRRAGDFFEDVIVWRT